MFSKLIKFFLIFIVLLIAILIVSPLFVNKQKIINVFNEKIKTEFKVDIKFDKDIKLSFFPFPQLKVKDVEFIDQTRGIYVDVLQISILSSWRSLINLNPEIDSLELESPKVKLKKDNLANQLIILVKNKEPSYIEKVRILSEKIEKLYINNGKLEIYLGNKKNTFDSIEFSMINSEVKNIEAEFNYVDYKSFIKLDSQTSNFNEVKFKIIQIFEDKNRINSSGILLLSPDKIMVTAGVHSKVLDFAQIAKLITQLKIDDRRNIYQVKLVQPSYIFDLDFKIEKILFEKFSLEKTSFNLQSNKTNVFLKDFNSYFLNAPIVSNANYSITTRKAKGKIAIDNFLVKKEFLGMSRFDLSDAAFDCDIEFFFDRNNKHKDHLNKLFAKGECGAPSAKLIGLDIEDISRRVDKIEKFQDFFDLFKKDNLKGTTNVNSIDFKFNLKDSILNIDELTAIQKNIKIKSSGRYEFYKDLINFNNNVFIKTEKYNNLPGFNVFVKGTSNDYEISYDFDKIKSAVLTKGINSLLKNKKKLIIDPKSLKGIIEKNKREFDPEKIIDLFLN
ncbi:MAG: AsmA family protein [Pseudomonadota bacterium]|nr:AsmA family protein [Pseudomonadota bacterium]